MIKFKGHKYTWSKPFSSVRHQWQLIGPTGGVHFHASVSNDIAKYDDSCGLEFHHTTPPQYMEDDAPGDINCWLIGGRCWHDGTSLYASEHLWPRIKDYLSVGDHETIFRVLEHEYSDHFNRPGDDA